MDPWEDSDEAAGQWEEAMNTAIAGELALERVIRLRVLNPDGWGWAQPVGGGGGAGGAGGASQAKPEEAVPPRQPAASFAHPLALEYKGQAEADLGTYARVLPFRNNLATASWTRPAVFLAVGSTVRVFGVDAATGRPLQTPHRVLETKPLHTTMEHMNGANWPAHPHGINAVKIGRLADVEVLVTAGDDGRVIVISVDDAAAGLGPDPGRARSLEGAVPWQNEAVRALELAASKSAWGIDMHDQYLAVSDNSHRVHLWDMGEAITSYLSPSPPGGGLPSNARAYTTVPSPDPGVTAINTTRDHAQLCRAKMTIYTLRRTPSTTSPYMSNNIPDVAFVPAEGAPDAVPHGHFAGGRVLYLACISISGEIALWSFGSSADVGALTDEDDMEMYESVVDSLDAEPEFFTGRKFRHGVWKYRKTLKQEGWTLTAVTERDFKQVPDLWEVTSNRWIDEDAWFASFRRRSEQLLAEAAATAASARPTPPPMPTDDSCYLGTRFATLDIETLPLHHCVGRAGAGGGPAARRYVGATEAMPYYHLPICQRKDDRVRAYIDQRRYAPDSLLNPFFKDHYFVATSARSLYLLQAEDLYCNAAQPNVFRWQLLDVADEIHLDRISMAQLLRGLSAIIIVSQAGVVSLFRLVSYMGVHSLRQEYVFPIFEGLQFQYSIIVGIAAAPVPDRDRSAWHPYDDPHRITRYRLSVFFQNGASLTYDISRPDDELAPLSIVSAVV